MWACSVCFLCVKTFISDSKNQQNLKINFSTFTSKRFALFCERFLKLPAESPLISILCSETNQTQSHLSRASSSSSSFLDHVCSECSEILQATVQLYNELCEVQLKLAWRLGQWEALLKVDKESKPSSKLSSLLHQKLSEQLQQGLGVGKVGTEEIRTMRNLLLSHCKSARNQMMDHRKLEVALDRCSVPEPLLGERHGKSYDFLEAGTSTTSFLVLDSNPSNADVLVKKELEDSSHADDDDDHWEDFAAMDDFDFSNTNTKQESPLPSSSSMAAPESATVSRLRRTTKTTNFRYFPKKPPKTPKCPKIKKEKVAIAGDGISCEVCGKISPTIRKLRLHYHRHILAWRKKNKGKKPPFQCHFCWQSFTTQQLRRVHQEFGGHHTGMTSAKFTCYEEGCTGTGMTPFPKFEDLETHFENVHRNESESVHKCSFCEWPFSSDDMRQVHELVHGNYIRSGHRKDQNTCFTCPRCSKDFKGFPPLQNHFISEHTTLDSKRIYKCHKCSMSYCLPRSLTQHLKTHEMEEDLAMALETGAGSSNMSTYYVCEECGKHFATCNLLSAHKSRDHKTAQCNLCGETLRSIKMSSHRWHVHKVADDPHPCPVCQKIFHAKNRMKKHLENVHPQGKEKAEGEVCHICSKTYQRRGLLHRHLRTAHQIEAEELKRPARFVCPDCGAGYYYKASLDHHVDAKHRLPEDRKHHFPCTLCSKTFWRKCVLVKHLEEAHAHAVTK